MAQDATELRAEANALRDRAEGCRAARRQLISATTGLSATLEPAWELHQLSAWRGAAEALRQDELSVHRTQLRFWENSFDEAADQMWLAAARLDLSAATVDAAAWALEVFGG